MTAGMIVSVKPFVTRKGQAMAFLEIEDRIMTAELVAFPSVWKTASAFVKKGALVLAKAKVQQGDEDYKLLADEIVPLDAPDLRARAARRRRDQDGARARPRVASSPAGADRANPPPSGGNPATQRAYIRIDESHEQPALLNRLKTLLASHRGALQTVLYYDRGRRTVALSDDLRIAPTPELIREISDLLGEGAFRLK